MMMLTTKMMTMTMAMMSNDDDDGERLALGVVERSSLKLLVFLRLRFRSGGLLISFEDDEPESG